MGDLARFELVARFPSVEEEFVFALDLCAFESSDNDPLFLGSAGYYLLWPGFVKKFV